MTFFLYLDYIIVIWVHKYYNGNLYASIGKNVKN